VPLGDAAVAIELGRTMDPVTNARIHALDRALTQADLPGVVELVPTYRSLLVHYDPLVVAYEELGAGLRGIVARAPGNALPVNATEAEASADASAAVVEVPVVYGGEWGPDLADVARHAGLSEEEVVRRHAAGEYRVAMLGFAPGFPYLMGMDPAIACPRLATPRVRVPGGSVGIADTQTGIYPFAMPGGWRLIGRTALSLFDPLRDPPALLRPGSKVRFVPAEPRSLGTFPTAALPVGTASGAGALSARSLRVIDPGLLATVQDGGRRGYQRYGVPPSGAADGVALAVGNLAVGNEPLSAAIEVTAGAAEFEFIAPSLLAITGATVEAVLSGRPVPPATPLDAGPGDRLRLSLPTAGLRAYVCLAGGVAVPEVLGSRSTYLPAGFGGFEGRALRGGDVLPLGSARARHPRGAEPVRIDLPGDLFSATTGRTLELPFLPGGQWDDFPLDARQAFLDRSWRVSHQSDRIGLRLEGEPLDGGSAGIGFVSDGTVTGAIQVAGDGLPIALLIDRQTTGGYPKLGAIASVALHLLGQAQPGDELAFRPVSIEEAHRALRALDDRLGQLVGARRAVMRVQRADTAR